MDRAIYISYDAFVEEFMSNDNSPGNRRTYPNHPAHPDHHLAQPATTVGIFDAVKSEGSPISLCGSFVRAFNAAQLGPGYTLVSTTDQGRLLGALYPNLPGGQRPVHTPTPCWDALVASVLFFAPHENPFASSISTDASKPASRESARDQEDYVLEHAGRIFARQHRTHAFTLALVGDAAYLVRADREALFVSNPFSYKSEPEKLAAFFRALARMSLTQRGADPTATVLSPDDPRRGYMLQMAGTPLAGAEDHARRCFKATLDDHWPWHAIVVGGREFLVAKPHVYQGEDVLERPSRGYVALARDPGPSPSPFVWLKDTWRRIRDAEYEQEGGVLADLNRAGVRGVPTLVCHGDVPGQRIDLSATLDRVHPNRRRAINRSAAHIEYVHYRVVVQEVGVPVDEFRDSKELVSVILDCVRAHRDACKLVGILHRDISPGNLLMVPVGLGAAGQIIYVGVLNDWELAERLDRRTAPGFVYQGRRRGTWEFLSLDAMDHPERPVLPADDLESFLHALLSFALPWLPHNLQDVSAFDFAYFFCMEHGAKSTASALKRRCLTSGGLYTTCDGADTLKFASAPHELAKNQVARKYDHPINDIFDAMFAWTARRYSATEALTPSASGPSLKKIPSQRILTQPSGKENVTRDSHVQGKEHRIKGPLNMITNGFRRPSPRPAAKDVDVAAHDAFIEVLSGTLQFAKWPLADKTHDQLPH